MLNKTFRHAKKKHATSRAIETLEARRLFSVVLNQPLNAINTVSGSYPTVIDLTQRFSSTTIQGTVVRFSLAYAGTTANVDMELFDQATPLTVANFLKYVNSGAYNTTLFHRSVSGFIVQGGGYYFPSGNSVTKLGTVVNEFATSPRDSSGDVNIRGTVAMAKKDGDPDSADSEFFVNTGDNSSNLDGQNGGFTTFARIIGDGMTAIDQINDLPTDAGLDSPFDELPVYNYDGTTQIDQPNVVYVSSASVIKPISFTAISSNLSRVVPSISDDGKLVIAYQPNVTTDSGPVTITITATDLDGATLTTTFNVTLTGGSNLSTSFNDVRLDPSGASPVAFGNVASTADTSITRTLVLENTGSETLTNLSYSLPTGYSIRGTAPTSLISGDRADLVLQIDSTTTGSKAGTLLISAPSSATSQFAIPLSATVRLPVTLGQGVKSVVFTQGTGSAATTATFSLTGAGTADFSLDGDGLTFITKGSSVIVSGMASLATLTVSDTTLKSSIKLGTKGASLIDIGSVTALGTASLGTFNAKKGRLIGSLAFGFTTATDAQLRVLTLGEARNASISVGVNSDAAARLTFSANVVENTPLTAGYALNTIKVNTWIAGTNSIIQGTSIKSLSVKSDFGVPIQLTSGLATVTVTGQLAGAWQVVGFINKLNAGSATNNFSLETNSTFGVAKFAGDFSGSITAYAIASVSAASGSNGPALVATGATDAQQQISGGDIGKVAFKGNVAFGFFNAGNRIGTFSANAITQSRLYAGVTLPTGSSFPTALTDFRSISSIGSVKLTGKGIVNFAINAISARSIGTLQLGRIQTDGATNGIVADSVNLFSAVTDAGALLNLRGLNIQSQVPPILEASGSVANFGIALF